MATLFTHALVGCMLGQMAHREWRKRLAASGGWLRPGLGHMVYVALAAC